MCTFTRVICRGVMLGLMALLPLEVEAATVTQLDITGGSVKLDFGGLGIIDKSFTQPGTVVMDRYQPSPQIFVPVPIGHDLAFSLFTKPGMPAGHFPPPSGTTSGSGMTVNFTSLFAGVSSAQWSSWMTPNIFGSLNIGGIATGSFDQRTQEFDISWTHALTGIPCLTSWTFSLHGIAQIASVTPEPVPLPGAVFLFGSGMAALVGIARRNGVIAKE